MLLKTPKVGINYWSRSSSTLYPSTTSDKLQIDGAATFSSGIQANNAVFTSGLAATTGNFSGGLNVTSGATVGALLTASSSLTVASTSNISSSQYVGGSLTVASTCNISSSLEVLGEAKTGSFQMTSGASTGYYLMCNTSTGDAIWASTPVLDSGVYTPTVTGVSNTDGVTAYQCQYMRVGSVVTVSGIVGIDPTTAGVTTQIGISLPIGSNIGAQEDLGGTGARYNVTEGGFYLVGDIGNNRADVYFLAADAVNRGASFTFTYRIV